MKFNLKNIIKVTTGVVVALVSAADAALSLRGAKADVTHTTSSGSLTYRPDGVDSTLLCYKRFNSENKPVAFRMLDILGEDQYPENMSEFISVGKQANLNECQTDKNNQITRDNLFKCIEAIAAKNITGRKLTESEYKLIAEKVNYDEECHGIAKPKNATIPASKTRSFAKKANVTVETQPEVVGSFQAKRSR